MFFFYYEYKFRGGIGVYKLFDKEDLTMISFTCPNLDPDPDLRPPPQTPT